MAQHRLVMEGMIGRLLPSALVVHVHHKNEVPYDNRGSNLEQLTPSDHAKHHHPLGEQRVESTEEEARTALEGRTTLQAAELLGMAHMTLRRRYPHLLTKRVSPGGQYPPELVEEVRRLAADPAVGTRAATALLGMTPFRLRTICSRHEIRWVSAPRGRPKTRPA